jgi:regulator of nucleoside diphosphate kinase
MQKYGSLVIEKKEFVLLKRLMNLTGYYKDDTMRLSVKKLAGELDSAKIFDEAKMPNDVIRFNSTITIVSMNGWQRKFKLVMPNESDVKNDKVSILTPMGAAVIGYAEGDPLVWDFPSGKQQLIIKKVEQENHFINANLIL